MKPWDMRTSCQASMTPQQHLATSSNIIATQKCRKAMLPEQSSPFWRWVWSCAPSKVGRRDSTPNWDTKPRCDPFLIHPFIHDPIPRASQKRDASNCNSNRASSRVAQVSLVEYLKTQNIWRESVFCWIGSMMFYVNCIKGAKVPYVLEFQVFWFHVRFTFCKFGNMSQQRKRLFHGCKSPANFQHHHIDTKRGSSSLLKNPNTRQFPGNHPCDMTRFTAKVLYAESTARQRMVISLPLRASGTGTSLSEIHAFCIFLPDSLINICLVWDLWVFDSPTIFTSMDTSTSMDLFQNYHRCSMKYPFSIP